MPSIIGPASVAGWQRPGSGCPPHFTGASATFGQFFCRDSERTSGCRRADHIAATSAAAALRLLPARAAAAMAAPPAAGGGDVGLQEKSDTKLDDD